MSILVVQDNDLDARLAAHLLRRIDPHTVAVHTLAEARRSIQEQSWLAVVLDVVLPDGDSFDLLSSLTSLNYEGAVLALSGNTNLDARLRALNLGADDYLLRPYEPDELLTRTQALLRRARRHIAQGDHAMLRVGQLALDMQGLQAVLPGHRRAFLTRNEMRAAC